jgi:hypothetical protein
MNNIEFREWRKVLAQEETKIWLGHCAPCDNQDGNDVCDTCEWGMELRLLGKAMLLFSSNNNKEIDTK